MCDTDQNSEAMSSPDSCDVMWESIKIDIDQSRAGQEEQLQSLKGQVLRLQTNKSKPGRHSKRIKKMKKRLRKGAFRKAVDMITNALIARKVKTKQRLSSQRMKSMTAMKFEVFENCQNPTDCADLHPNSSGTDIQPTTCKLTVNADTEPMLRDQSVQVEDCPPMQVKDFRITSQECPHVLSNRCACQTILLDGLSLPLFVKPVTYGMNFETLSSCCSHRGKCIGLSHPEAENHEPTAKVITDQGIQTDDQTVSQQSPWKQMCEDLLMRFCSPNNISVRGPVDPVSIQLQKLSEILQNFQSNLREQSSSQLVTNAGVASQNSAFVSTAAPSLVLQPNSSSEPLSPDSLVNNKQDVHSLTRALKDHEVPVPSEKSAVTVLEHVHNIEKEDNLQKQELPKPIIEGNWLQSKTTDTQYFKDQEMQNSSSEMDTEIEVANITKNAIGNDDKSKGNTAEINSAQQCVTLTSVKRHLFNSNSGKTKEDVNKIEKDTNDSPQEKCNQLQEVLNDGKEVSKAKDTSPTTERKRAVALIQEANSTKASCEGIPNSPAFEEMDASEMENLLLVWRQQEQLHQDQGRRFSVSSSRASSPSSLFRKLKRPRELPAELRNVKILQPPPLERKLSSDTSALSILEKEARESPTVEEDEDIPETQMPIILQPKKRRLRLHPNPKLSLNDKSSPPTPPPLPVVFHKNNELKESSTSTNSDANVDTNDNGEVQNLAVTSSESTPEIDGKEGTVAESGPEENTVPEESAPKTRSSKRLKVSAASEKEKNDTCPTVNGKQGDKAGKKGSKSAAKPPAEKKQTKKGKSKKENEKTSNATQELKGESKVNENSEMGNDFNEQIKERRAKIKQNWLHERSSNDSGDTNHSDLNSTSNLIRSPSPSESMVCNPGILMSEDELKLLKAVPAYEVGKSHDLAVHVLLNPWRGISAKPTSKRFICPGYDIKSVTRALWDLRSNAAPEQVAERILSFGWKDVHPLAFKAMVSMFIVALARHIPFVIEDANCPEEDDTSSIVSDVDQNSKKKFTPLRVVATQPIFKGECIEGLRGLIIQVTPQEKERLKSWNLPKFTQGRKWAIFGPIAYLKRKETNFNTEVVLLSENLIAAKATRNILRGERLLVSLDEIEK